MCGVYCFVFVCVVYFVLIYFGSQPDLVPVPHFPVPMAMSDSGPRGAPADPKYIFLQLNESSCLCMAKASNILISLGCQWVHRSKVENRTETCNNAVTDQCQPHFLRFKIL